MRRTNRNSSVRVPKLNIKTLPLGDFQANCYIVTDDNGVTAVIDPGDASEQLFAEIKDLNVKFILLTHGHFDHISGVAAVKKLTGADVYIHSLDSDMLKDEKLSLAAEFKCVQENIIPDRIIKDGDIIDFASGVLVLHTPGHTPGSVCFKIGNIIFTGDTLFCRTIGRTDFPGGNIGDMINSVDRLQALPGDYKIYPGHNRSTTMEAERYHNRFIRKKNAYINSQS